MRTKKNRLLAVVLIIAVVFLFAGCSRTSGNKNTADTTGKTVVKIGYLPITHALAVFEEKERLEKEDNSIQIELVKFNTWSDLTDALSAGRIDGASVLVELAMNLVNNGADLKAIGLGHKDGNVVVVSDEIKTVKDLKGKTFAIPSAQSTHNILLIEMLKNNGMTLADMNVVQLAPTEMPSSLVSGAIDGYCVAEPYGAQLIAKKLAHVLYTSDELWADSECCAFVIKNSWIQSNGALAEEFIAKYYEAGNALSKTKAQAIAEKYLGQETATIEQSLKWISFKNLRLEKAEYEVLCQKVKNYKINENPPAYEKFVYKENAK